MIPGTSLLHFPKGFTLILGEFPKHKKFLLMFLILSVGRCRAVSSGGMVFSQPARVSVKGTDNINPIFGD